MFARTLFFQKTKKESAFGLSVDVTAYDLKICFGLTYDLFERIGDEGAILIEAPK